MLGKFGLRLVEKEENENVYISWKLSFQIELFRIDAYNASEASSSKVRSSPLQLNGAFCLIGQFNFQSVERVRCVVDFNRLVNIYEHTLKLYLWHFSIFKQCVNDCFSLAKGILCTHARVCLIDTKRRNLKFLFSDIHINTASKFDILELILLSLNFSQSQYFKPMAKSL